MKQFFATALLALGLSGAAFASENETINKQVRQSFEKEFSGAQYVNWEPIGTSELYHVTFVLKNERLNAYFDSEGQLLAMGRYVKQESLPLLISQKLDQKYKGHQILDVIEFIADNETSYIVRLQDQEKQLYVRAYYDGTTSVLKKSKIIK